MPWLSRANAAELIRRADTAWERVLALTEELGAARVAGARWQAQAEALEGQLGRLQEELGRARQQAEAAQRQAEVDPWGTDEQELERIRAEMQRDPEATLRSEQTGRAGMGMSG